MFIAACICAMWCDWQHAMYVNRMSAKNYQLWSLGFWQIPFEIVDDAPSTVQLTGSLNMSTANTSLKNINTASAFIITSINTSILSRTSEVPSERNIYGECSIWFLKRLLCKATRLWAPDSCAFRETEPTKQLEKIVLTEIQWKTTEPKRKGEHGGGGGKKIIKLKWHIEHNICW